MGAFLHFYGYYEIEIDYVLDHDSALLYWDGDNLG